MYVKLFFMKLKHLWQNEPALAIKNHKIWKIFLFIIHSTMIKNIQGRKAYKIWCCYKAIAVEELENLRTF